MFGGFDIIFFVLWVIVFFGILGAFVAMLVASIRRKVKNDNSPRLTVDAKVVAKRTRVGRTAGEYSHRYTDYYVTFEVESGDRMELETEGNEFGLLVEGDIGSLTFQGTRYVSFERKKV